MAAQYNSGNHYLSFGLEGHAAETVTYVKNLGKETTAGQGDWLFRVAPQLDYYFYNDAFGRNQISRYSLDPDANANTWLHSYSVEAMYTTRDNWEFSSKCNANFYIGYSAGFGAPQFNWNASISKTIKAVTLSLKGIDLLNQAHRNLQRSATSEYVLDTYRNVLGRYFLFSVSFNFGKMNPKKSQAVREASMNMAF